jgi:hypothetical protein
MSLRNQQHHREGQKSPVADGGLGYYIDSEVTPSVMPDLCPLLSTYYFREAADARISSRRSYPAASPSAMPVSKAASRSVREASCHSFLSR